MSQWEMQFHIVKRTVRESIGPAEQTRAYRARVLKRTFSILNVLAEGGSGLGVAELSEQVHLRKSTVHRLLAILERSRHGLGKNGVGITVEGTDASANPQPPATSPYLGFDCLETFSIQAIQESQALKGLVQGEYGNTL